MTTHSDRMPSEVCPLPPYLDEEVQRGLEVERQRLATAISGMSRTISIMQAQKSHIEALLAPCSDGTPAELLARPAGEIGRASANAVVALLEEHNHPMHYKQICAEIMRSGQLGVGGRKPENTLRTRFAGDERIERVGRGLFWLSGREMIGTLRTELCELCQDTRPPSR